MHYTSSMENPETHMEGKQTGDQPHDGQSLREWMDRAQRAHELVDAVDFRKVAVHDQQEVEKLTPVAKALTGLATGNLVEHVEGVDEIVPEIDAHHQRKKDLFSTLATTANPERLGRVLHNAGESEQLLPLELIPHSEGLPEFYLCVAAENAVGLGNFGVFISATEIFAAAINEPTNKHRWHIVRSRPYENDEEMRESVEQLCRTAFD